MPLFMKFYLNTNVKKEKRIPLQAPEYKNLATLRLVNFLIIGVFALLIFEMGVFIYNKVYLSIGQIQTIAVLKNQVGAEAIDFLTLDKIRENWDKKHAATAIEISRDPFNPPVVPINTSTST
jgi:hypothetical protein